MNRKLMALMAVVMAFGFIFSACSDDKNTNPPLTEGDPNDPSYQEAQDLTQNFLATMTAQAVDGYGYMEWDGGAPFKVAGDSSSAIYNESSGWWVIYVHHDDTLGNDETALDSVRFTAVGGAYQMLPDSLTTQDIECRIDASVDFVGDTTSLLADISDNVHITGIQSEQLVFNGDASWDVVTDFPQWDMTLNYDASLTAVTFNRDDLEYEPEPHPVSGSMALALHVHTVTPEGTGDGNWAITVTFFVDHFHARFESGGNYWEWDGQYGG